MNEPPPVEETVVIGFEVHGARASIALPSPELIPAVVEQLPLGSTRCAPLPADHSFALTLEAGGGYALLEAGEVLQRPPALEGALEALRRKLFRHGIEHARERLVVHAGVVGHAGSAIVLPGPAMVGKTTLVAELVRLGASYYADDFAFFDPEGNVHPYPSRMVIKGEGKREVESLGGTLGDRPIPVGLIAHLTFDAEGAWDPRPLTPGEGMLMLLRNAYGLDAPRRGMEIARAAAMDVRVLEGERGEAAEAACALLELVDEGG